jgi:DNA-binding LacI/PurR family transcriptional regulator
MTYEQIARLAGVSTATVSRVLAGGPAVSDERRERVLTVVKELDYRGNRAARSLRRQRADAIGLVVSDVEYPFFAAVARVIETAAAKLGYAVLICNTDEDLVREQFYFDLMIEERVAGVIVSPAVEDPRNFAALTAAGIPVVTLDRCLENSAYDGVLIDNAAATDALIDDLLGHGHLRFAAIMGTTAATPSRERIEHMQRRIASTPGATLTVAESGLQGTVGVEHTLETVGGQALALRSPDGHPPTAYLCANAIMLTSVMAAFALAGIRVPEDAAVVGFDDMTGFDLFATPVTVTAQPTDVIGSTAAKLLFDRIDDPARAPQIVRVPPQLRVRRSCGHGPTTATRPPVLAVREYTEERKDIS